MTDKLLTPFKSHFEYSFQGRFKDFFDEDIWSSLFIEKFEIETKTVIQNLSVLFNIPYLKKGTKITLDFEQIHTVHPEKITKSDYNNSIEFKFNSKPIEVLQILKDDITFSDHKSEVSILSLDSSLVLKRS